MMYGFGQGSGIGDVCHVMKMEDHLSCIVFILDPPWKGIFCRLSFGRTAVYVDDPCGPQG